MIDFSLLYSANKLGLTWYVKGRFGGLPEATLLSKASYVKGNSPKATPLVWSPFSTGLASMCPMVQGSPLVEINHKLTITTQCMFFIYF